MNLLYMKNLQEQISRIQSIMETTNYSKELPYFIRRRFTEEELDNEFKDALEYTKALFKRYDQKQKTLENYTILAITVLMDNLHPILTDRMPENVNWYDMVENSLKDYYSDRIARKYNSIYNA